MKISVIGLGYIGLPTAISFARKGHKVFGYDVSEKVIQSLQSGQIHIVEDNLQNEYFNVFENGSLSVSNTLQPADAFIISVPTPLSEDKKADMSYVWSAAKEIGKVIEKGNLVILESTSMPLSTKNVARIISDVSGLSEEDYHTVHCPERVLPGQILYELEHNDRIVGAKRREDAELAKDLYQTILNGGTIHITDDVTAEMCKLVENSFRDVNIAFANELSMICRDYDIDVTELIALANKHPRVNILSPGVGVGGHCISVDPWFIVDLTEKARLIKTAREENDRKPIWVAEQIDELLNNDTTKKIGILGMAYKPDIDDLRESPSIILANKLKEMGYAVFGCEPNVDKTEVDGIDLISLEKMEAMDYIYLAQEHIEFKNLSETLKSKLIHIV